MRLLGRCRTMVPAVALTGAVLLLSACGGGSKDATEKPTSNSKVPPTATGSLEEIAAKSDCGKIKVNLDVDEVRQGICKTADGRYVLATFKTKKGQQDWLKESKPYAHGGRYLVGKQWVAVGDPPVVKSLRGRLGGEVEQGEMADHEHAAPSSGGSDSDEKKNENDGQHGKH